MSNFKLDFSLVKHVDQRALLQGLLKVRVATQVLSIDENVRHRALARYLLQSFLTFSPVTHLIELVDRWRWLYFEHLQRFFGLFAVRAECLREDHDRVALYF